MKIQGRWKNNQSGRESMHEQQLDTTPRSKEGDKEVVKTFVIYTRRKRDNHPPFIVPNSPSRGQSSTLEKDMENISPSFFASSSSTSPLNSKQPCSLLDINLDIPIAIRKGVRTYTQHPLANFLSYHWLRSTY